MKDLNWRNIWNTEYLIGLLFFVFGIIFYFIDFTNQLAPELIGLGIGLTLVEFVVKRREENEIRTELISNLGSKSNHFTTTAARSLRRREWLFEGWLEGQDFGYADLRNVDLSRAKLSRAKFIEALLVGSNLAGAELKRAIFDGARLEGANLALANLQGAEILDDQLKSAVSLEGAVMPDGIKLKDRGGTIEGIDWFREPYLEGPTFEEWILNRKTL